MIIEKSIKKPTFLERWFPVLDRYLKREEARINKEEAEALVIANKTIARKYLMQHGINCNRDLEFLNSLIKDTVEAHKKLAILTTDYSRAISKTEDVSDSAMAYITGVINKLSTFQTYLLLEYFADMDQVIDYVSSKIYNEINIFESEKNKTLLEKGLSS